MAIVTALPGFTDLGQSGPERDFIYNYLHVFQKWTKKST